MLAVARWNPTLAREQVYIFLDQQGDNGFIPDCYNGGTLITQFGKPPVFPSACVQVDRLDKNDEFMRSIYPKFRRYEDFWYTYRSDSSGLFHYQGSSENPEFRRAEARMESGWDNSVRWDIDSPEELHAIDLNCYMVEFYRSLSYMAERVGDGVGNKQWTSKGDALAQRINHSLWDTESACYMDFHRSNGRHSGVLSPAAFLPLYIGIAPAERAAAMARIAADPLKFHPGMPSISYDHPSYESFNYGRGPTWLNSAYWALKGLKNYGHVALAEDMRNRILDWCDRDRETLHEWYDSRTGQGMGARDFGWTAAFIIEFILDF